MQNQFNNEQALKARIAALNQKYENAIQQGKYILPTNNSEQQQMFDENYFNLQMNLNQIKIELKQLNEEIKSQQEKKKELLKYQKMQFEKKQIQAKQFITKLEQNQFERKMNKKFKQVHDNLQKEIQQQIAEKQHQKQLQQKQLQKRIQIEKRLQLIKNRAHQRHQSLLQKSISRKRLYKQLEVEFAISMKKEQENIRRVLEKVKKKQTDWENIKEHQEKYTKAIEKYELHKNKPRQESCLKEKIKNKDKDKGFISQRISRTKSLKIQLPPIRKQSQKFEQKSEKIIEKSPLLGQELRNLGNLYMKQSVLKLSKPIKFSASQNNIITQSSSIQSTVSKNYISQIQVNIHKSLHSLTKKLSKLSAVSDDMEAILKKSKMIDNIVSKKELISKLKNKQDDDIANLYLENIKNKLKVLSSSD